jgi:hypothetical protein
MFKLMLINRSINWILGVLGGVALAVVAVWVFTTFHAWRTVF